MGTPATELTDAILLAASAAGHRLFRNQQGIAIYANPKTGKKSRVPYGIGPNGGGGGDLVGICSDGIFGSVEVKAGLDQPTEAQLKWAAFVRKWNGRAGIARTVDEALAILSGK